MSSPIASRSRSRSRSPVAVREMSTWSGRRTRKFKERIPDRFDGTTSWRDYWAHFEACWNLNEWSADEAVLVLAASLSKSACKVLNPKPRDSYGKVRGFTIEELKGRLERRYGPGKLADNFLAQLKTRRQDPQESVQELGEAISELAQQAYPDVPDEFLERMSVVHFRDAIIKAEIRAALFRSRPTSLDEAVKTATEAESFIQLEAQRDRPSYVRSVVNVTNSKISERLDKIEERQEELMILLTNLVAQQHSARKPTRSKRALRRCFNCNEVGHIQENCPYLSHDYQQENKLTHLTARSSSRKSKIMPPATPQDSHEDQMKECPIVPDLQPMEACDQPPTNMKYVSEQAAVTRDDSCTDNVAHQSQSPEEETGTEMSTGDLQDMSVTEPLYSAEVVSQDFDAPQSNSSNSQVSSSDVEDTVVSEVAGDVKGNQGDNVWMENVVEGMDVDKVSKSSEYQDMTLWNVPNWSVLEWNASSFCIGYLCACFSAAGGGVLCLMWPVYGVWIKSVKILW